MAKKTQKRIKGKRPEAPAQPNPKNVAEKIQPGWRGGPEVAEMLGCSLPNLHQTYLSHVPAEFQRVVKGKLAVHVPTLIRAWVDHRVKQAEAASGGDSLMEADGDSPSLERWRAAKADLAEMERDRARKTHIDLAEMDELINRLGSTLRGRVEALQRTLGPAAAAAFNEMADEFTDVWRRSREKKLLDEQGTAAK